MEKWESHQNNSLTLKALMGDKSDNIPGVTKVGEKQVLNSLRIRSLEGVYETSMA